MQFVSLVPDPPACAVDALSLYREDLDQCVFPPVAILDKAIEKFHDYPCRRIILIAPGWPNMPWFWDITTIASQIKLFLPNLLNQPFSQIPQRNLQNLNLHASANKKQYFSVAVAAQIEAPQRVSTRSVYEAKWTIFTKVCHSCQIDFRAPPVKSIAEFLLYL